MTTPETPQDGSPRLTRFQRRLLLRGVVYGGLGIGGWVAYRSWRGGDDKVIAAGRYDGAPTLGFPAKRNTQFEAGRPITDRAANARYTNFYEFSQTKRVWAHMDGFDPSDWRLEVTGHVANPMKLDMDDLAKKFSYEERVYRHRCVEAWSMVSPWTGFALQKLVEAAQPTPAAKYVRFVSHVPDTAQARDAGYPWPYREGLTLAEAANPLTFIATGMYGEPLLKQHGAPVRLVVPWKYGFKSAKSIVRIEFTATRPLTFWNVMIPEEYGFEANVDPQIPHPRWSQETERDIHSGERRPTQKFNGYGEFVANLYRA